MLTKRKILYKYTWTSSPLILYENGIEMRYFRSNGLITKSSITYRSVEEIESIYPYELFPVAFTKDNGLQIETIHNEIGIIPRHVHLRDWEYILKELRNMFNKNWELIFQHNKNLAPPTFKRKIGQFGIHHKWKYQGIIKGWM